VLEDRLGRRDFSIDLRAGTVTCPGGQTAAITTSPQGARAANFSPTVCGGCALKDRCCPGRPNRHIALGEHEQFLLAARQALNDPATAAHLRHTRPRIERLLGLLAHRWGAQKPVHRQRQSPIASQLGRRAGQPQPDRPSPRHRDGMAASQPPESARKASDRPLRSAAIPDWPNKSEHRTERSTATRGTPRGRSHFKTSLPHASSSTSRRVRSPPTSTQRDASAGRTVDGQRAGDGDRADSPRTPGEHRSGSIGASWCRGSCSRRRPVTTRASWTTQPTRARCQRFWPRASRAS
jgi:hypothetical protein